MYDLIVVGGAVGASWGGPAGWAAFAMVPGGPSVKLVAAGAVPLSEADILPFAAAMTWHSKAHQPCEALFITDSADLAATAWPAFPGYEITWQYQPRSANVEVFQEADRARSQFARDFRQHPQAAP